MHGWASDARCWEAWRSATNCLGWEWQCGERGYGPLPPLVPRWNTSPAPGPRRLILGHSLGPHLLPADVLGRADAIVLLASFAAFVLPGREGRRTRVALRGMASCMEDESRARPMLTGFLAKAAAPQPADLLPPGPIDGPLDLTNRTRLREDLRILESCTGLPDGFPASARILIVEAGADRIVESESRQLLRAALPQAEIMTLPDIGHALLCADLIERVMTWVEKQR
jgi:pimeloyl-[acyl-carrier protein] methyl ester esterase